MEKNNNILDNFLVMDNSLKTQLKDKKLEFPFSTSLNFKFIIEHIRSVAEEGNENKSEFAKSILSEYEKAHEMHGRITDIKVTEKYKNLIENIMMFVFPSAFYEMQTYAACSPFSNELIYAAPKFRELVKIKDGEIEGELNLDFASYDFGKSIIGYVGVLSKFYGVQLKFEFPIIYKILDNETGLDRYFKINSASEFVDIIPKGEVKKLSKEDLENIRSNIYDLDYLKSVLEPENFEYSGFIVLNVINISDTEILSSIKKDLIRKDTINSFAGFLRLQHKIKSLLKCPGLLIGITDYPGSKENLPKYGRKIANSFLMNDNCLKRHGSFKNSIYDYLFETRKALVIEDLSKYSNKTKIEEEIINQDILNIVLAPLILNDEIVGILEIGAPKAGQLDLVNTLKLREVLPLFAMAVERSREETNNKVSAVIKEKCTAIHPTLEWKFQKAALNYLKNQGEGIDVEMEEIIFKDVYPLFGLSDIRNSSKLRNEGIRDDMIENLELARKVILIAKSHKELNVFNEITFRIDKKIRGLKYGIDSGDEAEILKFLSRKVVPLFNHIRNYGQEVKEAVEYYESLLSENFNFVYKKRKKFEESFMKITNVIAAYLDEQQKQIQDIYPHYYERYKTDGVDHSIYIGESLVENKKFDRLYLRNIRLWQLIMMCGIVRKVNDLKLTLPIPLETAHLILVQDTPLTIKFRYDEKKFDVDGAYNIKYEIMKKRIDKAEIMGREERLTQPDKIAIVYSQTSEAQEYSEYIEYLQSLKYLKSEVEELDLEELPGVKGLKALRVSVDLNIDGIEEKLKNEALKKAVKKDVS